MYRFCMVVLLCITLLYKPHAQKTNTDANIIGHIVCNGEYLPFVTVFLEGTTIGTTSDQTGHYQLTNLPEGIYLLKVQALGYKPKSQEVSVVRGVTEEVKFNLEEDVLGLEQVVVTGDRNEKNRTSSSVIVSTISPKLFSSTQSGVISEGLNFVPGLRTENNCQNCGFSQVRMNGFDGPYTQILIDSRPIFSGLAGVYGLELIPANMIERVEVIRGGGSALYGSNAIAGTINLILSDPLMNTYEVDVNTSLVGYGAKGSGKTAPDYQIKFNTSLISDDHKTGMAVYGNYRQRDPWDANSDDFSELVSINNTTLGGRFFQRFGTRSKISADFFNIREERRGGDKFDSPVHEAKVAEWVKHNITTGALSYDQFFREIDLLSIYASGQSVERDSYYGANQSLKDYGRTDDFSFAVGAQYKIALANSTVLIGVEDRGARLVDTKLGYADYENAIIENDSIIKVPHTENTLVADQQTNTLGSFIQYEYRFNKLTTSLGARFDSYVVSYKDGETPDVKGRVLSPRVNVLYDVLPNLQGRVSYSQGYRAPQIFDEDLHIEASAARKVIHKNSPDLKQETSHSFMASLDYNYSWKNWYLNFLAEGFYTKLIDPFVIEHGVPDAFGTVIYTRVNAEAGAVVQGVNLELNLKPGKNVMLSSGFTVQSGKYTDPQEFNEKKFFRSPNNYGFLAADFDFLKGFCLTASGTYTGKMLVPFYGVDLPDPEAGELRESPVFFDLGMKLQYQFELNNTSIQVYAGVKNVFNSYQSDFDYGADRDPGYVYGSGLPRTIYFGLKLGNFLR